ncbi:MAG: polyphosphate polymerase domain-containing protein [Faecousia sp.]
MAYQSVFKRWELKYLLTREQKERILQAMSPYMALDEYGRTTIRNLYYDTETYRLARHSMEKPVYKEKLRVRSYAQADPDSPVFVELKKKYQSIVYKRRLSFPEAEAMAWVEGTQERATDTQIAQEIAYFLSYYEALHPTVFLSYDREAYYAKDGSDFRITFDEEILARREALSLEAPVWGTPLLDGSSVLMEVKCSTGIPLWLTRTLSREKLYKTSFSKYGAAYQIMIYPTLKEEITHA